MNHTSTPLFVRLFVLSTLLSGAFFLAHPPFVNAQNTPGGDPLEVMVEPKAPAPGEETTITLSSTPLDLSRSTISWSLDGNPKQTGPAERSFTFMMGRAGVPTTVSVEIIGPNGSRVTRSFTFRPGSVTLVWEADTYVPPFYMGKRLYTPGASVRVLAIPDVRDNLGGRIPAQNLVFKWSLNNTPLLDRSGLGKNVFSFTGKQLNDGEAVSVEVLRSGGIVAARGEILIEGEDPVLLLYKHDPLRGMLYHAALTKSVTLSDTETSIQAEPYFISGDTRRTPYTIFTWGLNDREVTPDAKDPTRLTLRQSNGEEGSARLSLELQNADLTKLLQRASASLTILFGTQ